MVHGGQSNKIHRFYNSDHYVNDLQNFVQNVFL